jgi:AcrR family transcriptional regulator
VAGDGQNPGGKTCEVAAKDARRPPNQGGCGAARRASFEIAAEIFMEHGFDGTSMERLAETAMIGKATLYARYADKGALFADILRRRILLTYGLLRRNSKRA